MLRSYAQSDMRVFEVPCPECGERTEILWQHIEWEPDRPDTAAFRCPHCQELIPERHKAAMIDKGKWRATRPEIVGHAGFRINALVSPHSNASWGKLATEFLAAKDSPDQLQTFVNTILAQGWREAADEVDENDLASRAEDWSLDAIPAEVLIITCGIDVQDDRVEISFIGHSRDETFVLGHSVVWGAPADDSTWAEVDDLLRSTWTHPNGGTLRVDAAVVDSGDGGHTDIVYNFVRSRFGRKVVAGKGMAGNRPAIVRSSVKGAPMFLIGVDGLKAQILTRLARGRTIRFSQSLEPVYFEQVASERRVVRYVRGQPFRRFERIPGKRAEALDCLVYGLAARQLVTVNLDRREAELASVTALAPSIPLAIKSKWMDRS